MGFSRILPIVRWLPSYERAKLKKDLPAGLTTAVLLIPQGMAYAMLAGLPPITGLYAAVVPLFIYALLGTSRQLAIGPVAADSLLVGVAVMAMAEQGTDEYAGLVLVLCALVGAIQFALGLLRAGRLVSFLSQPVITGFMSAAALVIFASQAKYLLGAPIPSTPRLHEWAGGAAAHIASTHALTLGIGIGASLVLVVLRKRKSRIPGALAVVVVGTLLSWALGFEAMGVAVVGTVPAGLPAFALPAVNSPSVLALLPAAFGIALVGYMEAIGVGKEFARKGRYAIDAGQELFALGTCNMVGSCFGGYPVTAGLSRSAVHAESGATTQMAGVVTGIALCLSLLFLTPLFYHLPLTVLAAIVMTAVVRLIDVKGLRRLWRVRKSDALLFLFTFTVTCFVGMQSGIAAGVVASLVLFVQRTTQPHHAVLGRLQGTQNYRNLRYFPDAIVTPGVAIWRFDASFYFANADFFRDQVDALLASGTGEEVCALVLDASGINDLDASGEAMLQGIVKRFEDTGIILRMANVKGPVRHVMALGGLRDAIGEDNFFFSVHEAVLATERCLAESSENTKSSSEAEDV
ncbi:MAG: SulP family inorganic anion transporter [Polyangiales bacterium]